VIKAMHVHDGAERSPLQLCHQRADRGTATTRQILPLGRGWCPGV
jgi:hypothetical protein